jgi:hypothetical protein
MSALKFNDQTINTFDEKIDLFKKLFFVAFSSIDLKNIKSSYYSTAIDCSMIIIEFEIITTIKRIFFDKISSFDDITNKLIKTCFDTQIKLLTSLFQIASVMHIIRKFSKWLISSHWRKRAKAIISLRKHINQ